MQLGSLGAALALAALAPASTASAQTPPALVLAGDADAPRPQILPLGPTLLQLSGLLVARLEHSDAFAVDRDDTELPTGRHADLLARVGLGWSSHEALAPWLLAAEFELDAWSGRVTDAPDLEGEGLPNSADATTLTVRKAALTFSYERFLTLRAGLTTSQWGLGLVANDGTQGFTPGSARFHDPRGGDRVLRGQIIVKTPGETSFGLALAFDQVQADESLLPGDKARQAVFAGFVESPAARAGFYTVGRFQRASDDAETHAFVADLHGLLRFELAPTTTLTLAAEVATVFGTSALAPTALYPEHDLLQLGAALRASLDAGHFGGVLDVVFASGDPNPDDATQSTFKADPNFNLGLVLFPYQLAAHTGRAAHTAASPDLLGYPPEDLDRFPTRGAVANTLAFFPRLWLRPTAGLEVYAGPLFAFAPAPPIDPLNTRLAGGAPRNARDASPGTFYGTELDLGVRYSLLAWGSALTAGLELGLLLPGSALDAPGLASSSAIAAARATLSWKL